jgi:hypothetical protein
MKVFIITFCLFMSVDALAQDNHGNQKDSLKHAAVFKPSPPLIVVNGMVYDFDSLKNIKNSDILSIDTLKYRVKENSNPNIADRGAIIIITKEYAVGQYQKKLSSFSIDYKNYLETHQNNDSGLFYVLNGVPLEEKTDNTLISKLYEISVKKVKKVVFLEKYYKDILNNNKPIVGITTKH